MNRIIHAEYSGFLENAFKVTVENSTLDEDIHKMIVWIMLNPHEAQQLVPDYLHIAGLDPRETR